MVRAAVPVEGNCTSSAVDIEENAVFVARTNTPAGMEKGAQAFATLGIAVLDYKQRHQHPAEAQHQQLVM